MKSNIFINSRTKSEGELLVRRMSKMAQEYYSGDDSIVVSVGYRNDDNDIDVSFDNGQSYSTYTFAELEQCFEDMQRELDEE